MEFNTESLSKSLCMTEIALSNVFLKQQDLDMKLLFESWDAEWILYDETGSNNLIKLLFRDQDHCQLGLIFIMLLLI